MAASTVRAFSSDPECGAWQQLGETVPCYEYEPASGEESEMRPFVTAGRAPLPGLAEIPDAEAKACAEALASSSFICASETDSNWAVVVFHPVTSDDPAGIRGAIADGLDYEPFLRGLMHAGHDCDGRQGRRA